MKSERFHKIIENRTKLIQEVLGNKAKEYALNGDRLHNFKVAAQINGESQARALWGMATKHLVSVIDLIEGRLEPTEHLINEKIGDMINYLILLEAIFQEGIDDLG